MQGGVPMEQPGMPARNPSTQGYMMQQQHHSQPSVPMGSPMLSPPVGFNPQQARAVSPGQFQPQGTMPSRSPVMMQAQPHPNMQMQGQHIPHINQGYASRQPSYNGPDVNGLEQHLSHMTMASPGPQAQHQPYASPSLPHVEAAPAKAKRAARAYHQEAAPMVQPQLYQQQQGHVHPYHQEDNQIPPQHPYANAPPPGPSQAYQQGPPPTEQVRPDYLQMEQPQGQVFPGTGIPQPPHNPGTKMPGLRNRIDPEQIPSVVTVQEQDQEIYDNDYFLTCSRGAVPLATTQYTAVDQGSSSPRFMRLTTYNMPATDDLANMSHVPLAMILQPFAQPNIERGEEPIYTVDFSEHGPPRCKRCRGYVNPWFTFTEAGQKFVCNLCGSSSEVPPEYFSHLDVNGRRLDLDQRPELLRGTIDMVVPRDYWVQDPAPANSSSSATIPRPPQPLHYIFALDVSCDTSHRRGGPQEPELRAHPMLAAVTRSLKEIIYGSSEAVAHDQTDDASRSAKGGLPSGAKVAIVTFDKVVHFYNLKAGLDKPQMLVVGDIEDMFVPLNEGFLVDAWDSRSLVENLLDSIPGLFASSTIAEAAMGGPIKASLSALKNIGGQLNIFQTRLPTVGPGALKHRDEAKLQGTDKEKTLFVPQDPFYRAVAEEAVEAGIGINLFLFPSQFIDVASLGSLPGLTGGDVFFHPRFDPVRDGLKLQSQLSRLLTRETAYSVTMRIRCSEGLRVAEHFGNFYQRNVTDLEFGSMDADKAVAALVKHESKLDDKRDAHFQCAVLYTSSTGERRVRLHNVAVPVTQVMSNVFRFADMDATIAYCMKQAIAKSVTKPLREVRDQLTELCTKVLLAYRKHCASTTSPGQLILPESFKLFPVYALSFIKTKAMKGGPVVSDVRTFYMRWIKSMGVSDAMDLLYPKMMPIHTLSPEAMQPDEQGRVRLPRLMRCSYARMEPHGAYLIQNGDIAIIWLGQAISPQILHDLYGVDSLDELSTRMTRLPNLPTRLSEQLRLIISTWEQRRGGRRLPLYLARQNIDGIEVEFSNMLVEDANNDALSYVDYLCLVHKNIQQELSGEKQQSDIDAQTMWRTW